MSKPQNSSRALPRPQKEPIRAQKSQKITLRLSQIQKSEFKES